MLRCPTTAFGRLLTAGFVTATLCLFGPDRWNISDASAAEPATPGKIIAPAAAIERVEPWSEEEFRLRERLLAIAAEYVRYGRVDDEARWAPYLCRMPLPAMARFSAADDETGHGQKLYFLFARERAGYVSLGRKEPVRPAFQLGAKGDPQVVVKEAWTAEEYEAAKLPDVRRSTRHDPLAARFFGGSYYPFAQKNGKTYHAAKKAGLFVMFQADANALGLRQIDTDDGWLYGTLTADGKTVTGAGKMKSCIQCHEQAPHGRLFGLGGKSIEQPAR